HGGLTPANIRVTPRGSVKLLDFGLREAINARGGTGADPELWSYSAPEIILGGEPTPACDLYALGAILYELCIGEPFPSADNDGEATRALEKLAAVPKTLERVVASLLSPTPAARPAAIKTASLLRSTMEDGAEADLRSDLGALVQRLSQQE